MASRLQDQKRLAPVVVISTQDGLFESRFNEAEVARAIGSFAELVVVPTGALTRRLSGIHGDMFGMFGGAARVHPTDPAWMADPYQAPLIFAYPHDDAAKVTTQLIGAANGIADRGTRGPAFAAADSGSRFDRTIHIDADGLRERAAAVRTEGIKPGAFGSRPASAAPAPVVDVTPVDESDATASRKTALQCAQAGPRPPVPNGTVSRRR